MALHPGSRAPLWWGSDASAGVAGAWQGGRAWWVTWHRSLSLTVWQRINSNGDRVLSDYYVLAINEPARGFLVHLKLATTLWRRHCYCLHFTKEALRPGWVTCAASKRQSWSSAPGIWAPGPSQLLCPCRKGGAGAGRLVQREPREQWEGLSTGPVGWDVMHAEPVSNLEALGSPWRVLLM